VGSISVCCIVQNCADLLPGLLRNVGGIADEIVAVDGGSTDATEATLRADPKVRYFARDFDNYTDQKNHAIEQATGDWVLFVDADERLSDALTGMLPGLVRSRIWRWYKLPRYWVVPGDPAMYVKSERLYPDYQLRLFRNTAFFRYEAGRAVHERFPRKGRGPGRKLRRGHLVHLAFRLLTRAERERKSGIYSSLDPASLPTNAMYLWEDLPHELKPVSETWRD